MFKTQSHINDGGFLQNSSRLKAAIFAKKLHPILFVRVICYMHSWSWLLTFNWHWPRKVTKNYPLSEFYEQWKKSWQKTPCFYRYLVTTKSKLSTVKIPNYIFFWNFHLLQKHKIIPWPKINKNQCIFI